MHRRHHHDRIKAESWHVDFLEKISQTEPRRAPPRWEAMLAGSAKAKEPAKSEKGE
jgi:Uri superfamily endonuclease